MGPLLQLLALLGACRPGVPVPDRPDSPGDTEPWHDTSDSTDDGPQVEPVPCPVPTLPEGPGPWVAVDSGPGRTCALRADGTMACVPGPLVAPFGAERFVDVSVGDISICGLTEAGTARCVGLVEEYGSPPAHPMCDIAVAGTWGCGILAADGSLTCWGVSFEGPPYPSWEATTPANIPRGSFRALDLTNHAAWALDTAGHAHGWPTSLAFGDPVSGAVRFPEDAVFSSLNAGLGTCGITLGGELLCWGYVPRDLLPHGTDFISVSMQENRQGDGCAVHADGELVCWTPWGDFPLGFPREPLVTVSLGSGHGCGLTPAGDIVCWGAIVEGPAE